MINYNYYTTNCLLSLFIVFLKMFKNVKMT